MKFSHAAILAGSAVCANAAALTPRCSLTSKGMQRQVTKNKLMKNLKDFQTISDWNAGNRAFNSPGYTSSVNYVKSHLATSKLWRTWTQSFDAFYYKIESTMVVDGKTYIVGSVGYSQWLEEILFSVNGEVVEGPAGNAACTVAGYSSLDVQGKIVLVEGGACPDSPTNPPWYAQTIIPRFRAAYQAGALAVVVQADINYNDPVGIRSGNVGPPSPPFSLPSGYMSYADGAHLRSLIRRRAEDSSPVVVQFDNIWNAGDRNTQNLFTESVGGDPRKVIMLGAHLDSVVNGAGINDNGSGSSLLITLFHALQKYCPKHRIRLAWWGAEEGGLNGSNHYTSNLSQEENDDILLYLNFDMIGRGYFGVFNGSNVADPGVPYSLTAPPGSDVIEQLFIDYLVDNGYPITNEPLTSNTDHAGFVGLGKPVGGMHSGSLGVDTCYHRACDDINNVNGTHIEIIGKAVAHVLSVLDNSADTLFPPTTPSSGRLMQTEPVGMKPDGVDPIFGTVHQGDKTYVL
ncbi:hypothetical protein TWF281_004626 [Arthrobotrys megalospora]